jgi:N6-adenosine-specific RNA methylase IME4
VRNLAAKDCVLFLWVVWPMLEHGLKTIDAWGFKYKTCGFAWMKSGKETNAPIMGTGYWTRANTEVCLLATKGKPKRISAGVAQAIYEPRREHSRKPDCVNGPYLELFARRERPGWDVWGNQTTKFNEAA